MPSSEFSNICRKMKTMSDTLDIAMPDWYVTINSNIYVKSKLLFTL